MLKVITALYFALIGSLTWGFAQKSSVAFEEISLDSDLSYDQIEYIHLDRDGFTWIATSTGLHKLDGFGYETFLHHAKDSNSIAENFSSIVFEDSRGRIWVGTYNHGLSVYDKSTTRFYTYRHREQARSSLSGNKIIRGRQAITEDQYGNIWVNTESGLNKINPQTQSVESFYGELNGHLLYDPKRDLLWIAEKTIKYLNLQTHKIQSFASIGVDFNQIFSLSPDSSGMIWLGTDQGLWCLNPDSGSMVPAKKFFKNPGGAEQAFLNKPVRALYLDFKNRLWVSQEHTIYILDLSTGSTERLYHDPQIPHGLHQQSIRGIYGNKEGKIYITYEGRGITRVNANINPFIHIHGQEANNSILGSNIRSILEDKQGKLWLGTYHRGLNCIDYAQGGKINHYRHNPKDPYSVNSDYITALYQDKSGRLWVGTFEDGFCYADLNEEGRPGRFFRSALPKKLEVHEFTEDPHQRIWISTDQGFYIYDTSQERLFHYGKGRLQEPSLPDLNIQSVVFEAPNIFWLATWNKGFAKLLINSDSLLSPQLGKDQLTLYHQSGTVQGATLNNRLITLSRDKKGSFWLGSNLNGLIKLDVQGGQALFTQYDRSRGAPSNSIYGVVEDQKGNIWVSSKYGIGKFMPENEQFINFYESDGLQNNVFIWDSYFQSPDGQIYFGGINGLNAFYPDSISHKNKAPMAYLKKLIINHQDVAIDQKVNGRLILKKNIRFTEAIELSHRESIFSIEFAALHANNPHEIQFEYKLESFDEDWIHTSAENQIATYTNLPAGTYYFKVRATRNYGIWQEPAELMITVLPPWWATSWAYGLYTLILIALFYFYRRGLLRQLALRHNLALEQYKRESDNQLSREKFQFFTNLSHELRTPLTLILGQIDRLIRKNEANETTQQNYLLIQKQALKLQKLTNQLLKFRKYDVENAKLKAAPGNIINFLKEIEVAFKHHAHSKEIQFELLSSREEIQLFWDRDKLEIVLVNLLSNAFKFTPPQGRVSLTCREMPLKEQKRKWAELELHPHALFGEIPPDTNRLVEFEIQDTGCGIRKEQLKHIFDRYFQAGNTHQLSVGGTGIGLAIAKNFVELHQGQIAVKSEEEKGTIFYVWLPLGYQHLDAEEIIQDYKSSEHQDHYSLNPQATEAELPAGKEREVLEENLGKVEKPTILVVDDNRDILLFLKESFSQTYKVMTASNGLEAWNLAQELIPDLVISDIMMPVKDGLALCNSLKSDIRTSHIPVILLTARTSTIFHMEGLETGADDYLTKPFDERILNIRVKNLISSRKVLRERYQKEFIIEPKGVPITQPDNSFLDNLISIIEERMGDSQLKVEHITKEIGMSHSVLYKKVMALTGFTVVEFIRTLRLKKAALLIQQSDMRISQISYEVGFTDPKYFSKCFQKQFGVRPSQYGKGLDRVPSPS